MVTSGAVLGAAAGTGLALAIAMGIVLYRYYAYHYYGKGWSNPRDGSLRSWNTGQSGLFVSHKELNISKEQHTVQPPANAATSASGGAVPGSAPPLIGRNPLDWTPILTHQSKSYPGGQPRLVRTPSVSSQGSIDSKQSSHRGSSPQIRTFGPEGMIGGNLAGASCESPPPGSPHFQAALSRSPSPVTSTGGGGRASSHSSLTSLASGGHSGSPRNTCGVQVNTNPARCLSPLLIPQRCAFASDPPPASPLGALQPDLYQRREGPLFLDAPQGSGQHLGRLHLRFTYDFDRSDLHVHLIEAHELAGSEQGGFHDPYVRLMLEPPVDARKRQTPIHRNEPNPYFDQHFKFPVSHDELREKILILQVLDYDRFSRNDIVGEVRMAMDEYDIAGNLEVWAEITKNKKPPEEIQEVLVSLSYLPSAERLTVVVLKARNLFVPPDKDNLDPFVKVYLHLGGKRVKKRKTAARRNNCNPVWNEALMFNVAASNLANAAIEVNVLDQGNELIGRNPLIGSCVVGPGEDPGADRDHWCEMTQCQRKAVAMWHTLR